LTGASSRWTNTSELRLGSRGNGNLVVVSNGAVLASGSATIGNAVIPGAAGNNNVVRVTDTNSFWTTGGGALAVGGFGNGNQLLVSNGGAGVSASVSIGLSTVAPYNVMSVTGPGSRWTSSGTLIVGQSSEGNQLIVNNGAVV